ncbi:undecaprenyl-diphosphate phosphatase [Oerskovia enterophila]|uniref:Undecaprenyl-diphosphatase n=1 Tax=Oerskovia enterophila TaxID=43678 RepID=A0A163QDN6_9CELL|nr:undecaprenyl-diphosphate phosphatase [Oerskovia enterophila]KZM34051.1 undecaprenyl-diphosphatase [Oerskovia enterophila]OCI31810.1 undecaprenyl-diphosphatase [Oerskovia enterophila]
MNAWEAILLGLVQGLTEFLPVSSSAHLRIVGELIGSADPGAAFTAITQIGTETAVIIYFRRDIATICSAWWRSLRGAHGNDWRARMGKHDHHAAMAWFIALGSIPIVVLGLAFQDAIEASLRNLYITALTLTVFALLLGFADRVGAKTRTLDELTPRQAVGFGLAQALALVPGVSRSGGTITAGLLMGFTREAAARYSFLLAIPAVLGSGFYQLAKSVTGEPVPGSPGFGATLIATLVAFVVGYLVIIAFLKIVSTFSYKPFVIYRLVLAAVVVVLLTVGVLQPLA